MQDRNKLQGEDVRDTSELESNVIVSPDTERLMRLPPNQVRTKKWPVLDAHGTPSVDLDEWELEVTGLVTTVGSFTWKEFRELSRVKVFADMHCVTRWSRLGNLWEGVSANEVLSRSRPLADAKYVLVHAYDYGWTTNLPLDVLLSEDALIADTHDGEPIPPEHGGPARLIIPRLYAWKSAKWVKGIELVSKDEPGFWERGGYHMVGDPWKEERYRIG